MRTRVKEDKIILKRKTQKAQISEQASHEAHEVHLERKVIEQSKTQETPLQRNGEQIHRHLPHRRTRQQ
ncbi:hypothetical protein E6C27_scaffold120G002090 [Cucumis melo var. makuwa]|uniref:Uncharacterized protein n=1 Tax=Cucumis melo var. makuwa TaxID=1194695 RepID=A0A5A7UA25_CUCMM|nr:hypothetical protein E6C27_scaffold120G002090 [Cucumis melo var. makuwa]